MEVLFVVGMALLVLLGVIVAAIYAVVLWVILQDQVAATRILFRNWNTYARNFIAGKRMP